MTVLNKEALALACTYPGSVYEGSADITLDCTASGAPGDDPVYTYTWTGWGSTANTDLLTGTDIASPTFYVPDEVSEDETYEYLLTVSGGECGRRHGGSNGDGVEQGGACARVHGSRFGLRGIGGHYAGLYGFGGSGRRSGSYVHMDRVGQHGEHGPADRYGHCFPHVLRT